MRLDKADDDVGATVLASLPLVEHRVRLADASRHAQVDAQPAALRATCVHSKLVAGYVAGQRPRLGRRVAQLVAIQQFLWSRAFRLPRAIAVHNLSTHLLLIRSTL